MSEAPREHQAGDAILESLFVRYPEMAKCEKGVREARSLLRDTFSRRGKVMVCGNGGSAADSEHIVGELMKSFMVKRPIDPSFAKAYLQANGESAPDWLEGALPAISLASQSAFSTAFCNDQSATGVFAQQVYGYGRKGDALIAISTSGNSSNVVAAAKVARALGVRVVAFTGQRSSQLSSLAEVCVCVPNEDVYAIQELHLPLYHALCAAVEADIFGGASK